MSVDPVDLLGKRFVEAIVAAFGRDFADGKSWEAWVRKYHEQKAARAAGDEVETIGIFSEPL